MLSLTTGFTLIELIVTIVVLGLVMIPLGLMSIEYMGSIVYSRDSGVAEGLAKLEMSKVNNLAYSDASLADGYDSTTSSYEGYPYNLRRTVNYVSGWSNNLKKVQVRVYPLGDSTNSLVNLITYVADASFGKGSEGGAVARGGESDSLVASGGSISGQNLQNVTLQNTGSSAITITGVIISFTGSGPGGSGIKLKTITMDSVVRWSGNASSGDTITLTTNFTLSAGTTYSNTGLFAFSKTLASVSSLVFIMSDGSQTSSYSW